MARESTLGLLAVAAGLAVALGAAAKRLARARGGGPETFRCDCGAVYRVHGVDRHRIYWNEDEPVLGDRCTQCDAPLPAGHDGAVV
jgi:hypothetical protein